MNNIFNKLNSLIKQVKVINNSTLFDPEWYRKHYETGWMTPAMHYLKKGWLLGNNPSEKFNTTDYLTYYPDVASRKVNPLYHYETSGKAEGRRFALDKEEIEYSKVPRANYIAHDNWPQYLSENFNRPGVKILEIGSRVVTGSNFSTLFPEADYTGFDIYSGPNVDVVGDAHKLSSYFQDGVKFDLIFSSAVFEHLAMPWIAANEIIKLLKVGGYVFIETHYSFSAHERPWHFFQFSDQALKVLFSHAHGIECIEAGVSNPIEGRFTDEATELLKGKPVSNMYCHSEFLGKKIKEIQEFSFEDINLDTLIENTYYPKPRLD